MGVGRVVKTTTRPDKRRRADAKTRSAAKGINDARGAMVVGLLLLSAVLCGSKWPEPAQPVVTEDTLFKLPSPPTGNILPPTFA
jgi:hypothetical protein